MVERQDVRSRRNPFADTVTVVLAEQERERGGVATILHYDYELLAESDRATVIAAARVIKVQVERYKNSILSIGQKLSEVKDKLPHGQWSVWLQQEFSLTERMGQYFISAYAAWGQQPEVAALLSDSVLRVSAGRSVAPAARQEIAARALAGEAPTKREAEAIIRKHRANSNPGSDLPETQGTTGVRLSASLGGNRVRLLTLDETIALIWRVLKQETSTTPETEPLARWPMYQDWLAAHDVRSAYIKALAPGLGVDTVVFAQALETVQRELENNIAHAQRTQQRHQMFWSVLANNDRTVDGLQAQLETQMPTRLLVCETDMNEGERGMRLKTVLATLEGALLVLDSYGELTGRLQDVKAARQVLAPMVERLRGQ